MKTTIGLRSQCNIGGVNRRQTCIRVDHGRGGYRARAWLRKLQIFSIPSFGSGNSSMSTFRDTTISKRFWSVATRGVASRTPSFVSAIRAKCPVVMRTRPISANIRSVSCGAILDRRRELATLLALGFTSEIPASVRILVRQDKRVAMRVIARAACTNVVASRP